MWPLFVSFQPGLVNATDARMAVVLVIQLERKLATARSMANVTFVNTIVSTVLLVGWEHICYTYI